MKKKKSNKFELTIEPHFLENDFGIITHVLLPTEAFFLSDDLFLQIREHIINEPRVDECNLIQNQLSN